MQDLTFSLVAVSKGYHSILIVEDAGHTVRAIDLSNLLGDAASNPQVLVAKLGFTAIHDLARTQTAQIFAVEDLTIV